MSTNMKSGDACDDSTKPFRTQRVEGTTRLTKIQPKLDTSHAWKHQKPLRALPPPACKENECGRGAAVANIAPDFAALKSHIRIAFQPRPAAGRRVRQQPPPRFEEKSPQSMPEVVAANARFADMNPPSQTECQHKEATGAQREVQEDDKTEVTSAVSKLPSGADTIGQAIGIGDASEHAAMQSEHAPLLATCRCIISEDAWQEPRGMQQEFPEDAEDTADRFIGGNTDDAKSTKEGAQKPANDSMHAPQHISSVDDSSKDRTAVQADETQDNPVTDIVSAGEIIQVSEPTGKDQENTQQRKNAQDKESFTWYNSYADLEDGVQFTLEELLKFNLLYPDSISDMCLSKLAALRSDQQNQVVCILYDAVTQKKLPTSVNLFLWDTIKTLPIMPYCLLAPSVQMVPAQEIAKSIVEKAANCDRIKGELDNYCWSTLASCSEAVQYAVFKDLNNAISNPKWQLANLPAWTMKSIHRHMPRLPRNANKATKVTTSKTSGGGLGQTIATATLVPRNDSRKPGGTKHAAPSSNKQWHNQSASIGKWHKRKAIEPAGEYAKRRRYH
ncbi:g9804 [Coccomyxa elongata]